MRNVEVREEIVLRPAVLSWDLIVRSLALLPHYRELFFVLTVHRLRVRYRQSALGPLWAILQPLAMMIIFAAVFSIISPISSTHYPYPLFAYAGLLPWTAFASALSSGATSLTTQASLVTKVRFPREILPMTYVAAAMVDLAVASIVLAGLLVYYDLPLTIRVLWMVPALALLALWATTAALVLGAINVRFRDVGVAMPLLLQFWMFATPVIYPIDAIPTAWRPLFLANPMAGVVDGFRSAVLNTTPDLFALLTATFVTLAALPLAYVTFKHTDATMADRI